MKVEVDFPADFESDRVIPIHLGRLMIGPHVARLYLCPDGNVRMSISKSAIEQGFIVTYDQIREDEPIGVWSET